MRKNDINIALLQNMQSFIEKEWISSLCSIERGDALQRLHFQAVFKIFSSLSIAMSKLLKTYFEWDNKGEAFYISHILLKKHTWVEVYTYIGMLGYCLKDRGEEHFEMIHNNDCNDKLGA